MGEIYSNTSILRSLFESEKETIKLLNGLYWQLSVVCRQISSVFDGVRDKLDRKRTKSANLGIQTHNLGATIRWRPRGPWKFSWRLFESSMYRNMKIQACRNESSRVYMVCALWVLNLTCTEIETILKK